ncbi:uncharacterized protein LAESUDRAFT_639225, partial [Laetiporus sulphureus 93-53]
MLHIDSPTNLDATCSGSGTMMTTIFVSNLHCSSCVRTIEDALSSLSPAPNSVDVSVVTQTITVRHSTELSPPAIRTAIDQAGFDIVGTPTDSSERPSLSFSHSIAQLPALITSKSKKHFDQC